MPRTLFDPSILAANFAPDMAIGSGAISSGQTYTVATAPSNAVTYSGANLAALATGGSWKNG